MKVENFTSIEECLVFVLRYCMILCSFCYFQLELNFLECTSIKMNQHRVNPSVYKGL